MRKRNRYAPPCELKIIRPFFFYKKCYECGDLVKKEFMYSVKIDNKITETYCDECAPSLHNLIVILSDKWTYQVSPAVNTIIDLLKWEKNIPKKIREGFEISLQKKEYYFYM